MYYSYAKIGRDSECPKLVTVFVKGLKLPHPVVHGYPITRPSSKRLERFTSLVAYGFEDYYSAFAPGSHPSLFVSPCTGRIDRRGGESTFLTIACNPAGQAGTFTGDLVVNLPEDMSKLSYKVSVVSF